MILIDNSIIQVYGIFINKEFFILIIYHSEFILNNYHFMIGKSLVIVGFKLRVIIKLYDA